MIPQSLPDTGADPDFSAAAPAAGGSGDATSQSELLAHSRRLQQLVEQVDRLREPVARALLQECLQSLLTFYGQGLERILELAHDNSPLQQPVFERLVNDPLVRSLLLIHGLHPLDLEARLRRAIEKVRPYMESHGGNVELLSLEQDRARLRLQGACRTCPSSAVTMELALRRAIEEFCPDLMGFEVEGVEPTPSPAT